MVGLGPGGNVDWMKFLMELIISSILIANPKFHYKHKYYYNTSLHEIVNE